jgi:mannose-6-phosphate isomerase-like protein (cupin superfamily)
MRMREPAEQWWGRRGKGGGAGPAVIAGAHPTRATPGAPFRRTPGPRALMCDPRCMREPESINVREVLADVEEVWSPRTIAAINDHDARVVRVQGEFTRHSHPETDEFFLVLSGSLTIRMDEGDVGFGPVDVYVVPRGRFHQPVADGETTLLLFEPSSTVNAGDTPSELTAERRLA